MIGISIKKNIGVGDAVQFSSVPENYYRATNKLLIDVSQPWFFDYNPYVSRNAAPEKVIEMWSYQGPQPRPKNREFVYLSLAERHASMLDVQNPVLRYPRLYRYEDFPMAKREMILLHTHGVSHGIMPPHIIDHVLKKYKGMNLIHIGLPTDPDIGIPKITTPDLWALAKLISECRMFIGVDSGPSWIAACYPDVILKKVRTKPSTDILKNWVPLAINNIHSHWDDRLAMIHNVSEDDIGFTASYRRI